MPLFAIAALALFACAQEPGPDGGDADGADGEDAAAQEPEFPAPDLSGGGAWLNTDRPLESWKEDLRGQVVLLDFWTYCCINCLHMLPVLERLEEEFAEEPFLIIGVHSNKFPQEGEAENIRQAILRYEIEHPVVVDSEQKIWREYRVRAWPTLVLVDPQGGLVAKQAGEVGFEPLRDAVRALLDEHREKGTLADGPLELEGETMPEGELRFPGKVLAHGERLYVADSTRHRILELDAASGRTLRRFGGGVPGFEDGGADEARFDHPQGMAVHGGALYVADVENHAIRRVDLEEGEVTTVAGDGRQARSLPREGHALGSSLNSPWALETVGDSIHVAMAGSHQLWTFRPDPGILTRLAGSGREDITDGAARDAALAQPSGLALLDGRLYFADSEVSGIRWVDLESREVGTVVGTGLFEFGDADGRGDEVRLQHPLGVAAWGERLIIADTYNNKIKLVDPATREVTTLYGTGEEALREDVLTFWEPSGVDVQDGVLYVADTNHHRIVAVDLASGEWRVVR